MLTALAENIETTVFEAELEAVTKRQKPHLSIVEGPALQNTSMHPAAFKLFAALNVGVLGVFWLTFRGDAEALFMVAISGIYLAAYVATPWIMSRIGAFDAPNTLPFSSFLEEPFETWTGVISGRDAVLQVLLIPSAILSTVIGMSLIIQWAG